MSNNVSAIKEQRMHGADAARNTNSKNIFQEPMLYAQFLRDNLNVPVLKNVQPEDIEDVSVFSRTEALQLSLRFDRRITIFYITFAI